MPLELPPSLFKPMAPPPQDEPWFDLGAMSLGGAIGGGLGFLFGGPMGAMAGAALGTASGTAPGDAVLDALGRPVRTAIHTGDMGRAWDSIFDRSLASSASDIRRDTLGIGDFNTTEGEVDPGDFVDFGLDALLGMGLDPTTFLGAGAMTKVGKMTRGIGMEAAMRLAKGTDAGDVARWYNRAAMDAEQKLGSAMPRLGLLPEGADDAMRAAHQQHVAGFLEHFGMGRTFRERLKLGQQTLLGYHLNPFGEASNPLWGGHADEAALHGIQGTFKPGTETTDFMQRAMASYLGEGPDIQWKDSVATPVGEYVADLQTGSKFADWMGEASDTIGAAVRLTPWGRKAADAAVKVREFIFNPVDQDALDEIARVSGSLHAVELKALQQDVLQHSKNIAGFNLEARKDLTDWAQWKRVAEASPDATEAAAKAKAAEDRLRANLKTEEEMIAAAAAVADIRRIEDQMFVFSGRKDKLGDTGRELLERMKAQMDDASGKLLEQQHAEAALNAARIERDLAESGVAAEQALTQTGLKNAATIEGWQATVAKVEQNNARYAARKSWNDMAIRTLGEEEAARSLASAEKLAAAWAKDHPGKHENDWFAEVALTPEDLRYISGAGSHMQVPGQIQQRAGENLPVSEILRKRVADMTPEERAIAINTDQLTGLGTKKAYEDSAKLPAQVYADADSLKWVNDNMGHDAGNELLRSIGMAMKQEGIYGYHISGDEYHAQFKTPAEAEAAMRKVADYLKQVKIKATFKGKTYQINGVGLTYGTASDIHAAEELANAAKLSREAAGLRAGRGLQPPTVVEIPATGIGGGNQVRGSEAGSDLASGAARDRESVRPAKQADTAAPESQVAARQPTSFMREGLRELGWTDEQINTLDRDAARKALAGKSAPSKAGEAPKLTDIQYDNLLKAGYSHAEIEAMPHAKAVEVAALNRQRTPHADVAQVNPAESYEIGDDGTWQVAESAKRVPDEAVEPTPKGQHGGARKGAGRPAKEAPEPTPEQRAAGEARLRQQQEQIAGMGRILRRSLPDADRMVIEQHYGLPGQRLGEVVDKTGPGSLETQLTAAAEVAFEKDWLKYNNNLGFEVPLEIRPIMAKMQRWQENIQTGAVKPSPIKRSKTAPKKPKLDIDKYTGQNASHVQTWDEYVQATEAMNKAKGQTTPLRDVDLENLRRAHLKHVQRAIENGNYVPRHVLDQYARSPYHEAYARRNEANLTGLRKDQTLSMADILDEKRNALREAEREYNRTGKYGDMSYMRQVQSEVEAFEKEIKNYPEHIQLYLTPEAGRLVAEKKLYSTGQVNNSNLQRKFQELGGTRPLTPREVNQMLTEDPKRAAGLVALAGRLPEGEIPMADLLRLMSRDKATWEEVGKKVGKTGAELLKLKPNERLKYASQAYAKVFDERSDVLLAANLESAVKSRSVADYNAQVRNLFGRKIKELDLAPEEKALIEGRRDRLAELRRQAQKNNAPELARQIEELEGMIATGHRAVDPGWVDASGLGDEFRGMMLKEEVYKRALKYRAGVMDTKWMEQGFMKHLTAWSAMWKSLQVGWPGSWVRDFIGNAMLRFQHNGHDFETLANVPALARVLASDGNAETLKNINLTIGGNKVDAGQFWREAMEDGVLGHNEINVELKRSLKGRLEQGAVGKAVERLKDSPLPLIGQQVPEFLRNTERLNMYHARRAKGDTRTAAAAAVDAALYNYARVSPFVDIARRTGAIPFATWASKNIPAQLELLVTRPGQFAALIHAKQAIENGVEGVDEALLPEWLRDKFNIVYERDEEGKVWFVTTEGVVPMVDIPNLFGKGVGDYMAEAFGPLPKAMIEQLSNRDLYTKQDIEKFDGELGLLGVPGTEDPVINLRTKNVLKNVVVRPMTVMERLSELDGEVINPKLGRPKEFWEQKGLVSALIGVGTQKTDPVQNFLAEINRLDRQANAAEAQAKRFKQRGRPDMAARLQQQAIEIREKMAKVGRPTR